MPGAGQTKPAVMPRLSDRIAIGVLTRTFPPELVDRVITQTGRAEQRQRLLPARVVLYYTLAMCLFAQVGYEEVMRVLVEGLAWARRWQGRWQVPDKSSIARARARLGRRRCGRCSPRSPSRWPPARRRGRGIGGGGWSRWTAPPWTCRTRPPTWRRSAGPQAAAGRGRSRRCAWWAGGVRHPRGRGRGHGRAAPGRGLAGASLGRSLGPGMLLLVDQGLCGLERWRTFHATRAELVWRCRQDVTLEVLEVFEDGSWRSELGQSQPKHKRVAVRVIDYRLDDPGRPGEPQGYRLITTIADPERAPAAELPALYRQRWEMETALDELKTHQRGPGWCCAARPRRGPPGALGASAGPRRHPHPHPPGRPGRRGRP
jgi:hypothetical protein